MRLRLLALSTTTILLAACGGDDKTIVYCAKDEFNTVDADLVLPASLAAAHSELHIALVSKESNRNIAQEDAKLSCIRDINECTGSISTEKAHPGQYTLTAYDTKGLPVGSTAVEIKKASSEAGCSAKLAASINTELKAYVLNLPLSGTLGNALQQRFGANFWTGQTDGIVMLSAADLDKLDATQRMQLQQAYKAKQFVLVANAKQADLEKFAKLLGERSAPISLKADVPHLDAFAMGSTPKALMDVTAIFPISTGNGWQPLGIEPDLSKADRANDFAQWIKSRADGKDARPSLSHASHVISTSAPEEAEVEIDQMSASFAWSPFYKEGYDTGTCDKQLLGPCYNTYQPLIQIWPVYVSSPNNGITDYFVVEMSANLAPQGCYGWYQNKGMEHNNRLLGYFAQHYYLQGKVYKSDQNGGSFWGGNELMVYPDYAPKTTAREIEVTTGVTWSLSGNGSVGFKGTEPTGTVGFSAGVSFSNSSKQTYTSMSTTANVASSAGNNPSVAQWDYDSKDYVKASVMPDNHACGGSGFDFRAVDGSEVAATYSPMTTYIWQANKTVREQSAQAQGVPAYGGERINLNVELDLGVLLGWAYWPDMNGECDGTGTFTSLGCADKGYYQLDMGYCAGKNNSNAGQHSLIFDVGCATNTEWGTMPLGPDDKSAGDGNPGKPKVFNTSTLHVPFADATAAPK